MKKMIILLVICSIIVFSGCVISENKEKELELGPYTIDTEKENLKENLDYCKQQLEDEKNMGYKLWDIYSSCWTVVVCQDDIYNEYCYGQEGQQDISIQEYKEFLEYLRKECQFSTDADEYWERHIK